MKNEKNLFYQLANLTNECVIGCDFVQDRFLFVPESDYRLLPASSYVSLSESFPQMKAYIHPDDQYWVEQLFSVMKEKLEDPDLDLAQIDHFAWQLRVNNNSRYIHGYTMLHVKFKPGMEQGRLCSGLFSITYSIQHEQDNHLSLHYYNREKVDIYTRFCNKWKCYQRNQLTEQQKCVLMLAQMGYSSREIAEKMFLSEKRIGNIKAKIYEDLHVNTIVQAIQIVSDKIYNS